MLLGEVADESSVAFPCKFALGWAWMDSGCQMIAWEATHLCLSNDGDCYQRAHLQNEL